MEHFTVEIKIIDNKYFDIKNPDLTFALYCIGTVVHGTVQLINNTIIHSD